MKLGARLVTTCAAIAISSIAAGQTLLWEHPSPAPSGTDLGYGSVLFAPGDLNFDGVPDVIVSCSSSPSGPQTNAGYVGVLSGADGSVIYEMHGLGGGFLWAPQLRCDGLAPGDVDGDGATDFWISYVPSPNSNLLSQLISGATGAVIVNPPPWAGPGYRRVGDLNGDGNADLVFLNGALIAHAGPGFTQVLWTLLPPAAVPVCNIYPRIFRSVVPMGDVDGDGIVDLLAGVSGQCMKWCATAPGSACVISGATGTILRQWNGSSSCDYFGWRVVSPGDLDGDGIS